MDEAYEATDFFPEMGKTGKWLYFTAAPVKNIKGEIIGAVETLEDITERKIAEQSLQKQAQNLAKSKRALLGAVKRLDAEKKKMGKQIAKDEAILASIGDGLVITGKKNEVIFANGVFQEMIGWELPEIAGKSLFDVMPCYDEKGDAVSPEKRLISLASSGEKPETAIFYYARKDGSRFPGAVTVRDIEFDGKKMGAVSVLRDVTREMKTDRAKSEFISLASHQLRDAPTVISWCAEALLNQDSKNLKKRQIEYIEEIYKRNKSAIALINDLLNVSRLDLGTFIIEPEELSLKDICENEAKQFDLAIKEKDLEVIQNYDAKIPKINADPQLTQVIFQNLISNAVYYTPFGGKISIDLSPVDDVLGKRIVFKIADTGCGIPKPQQAKIFNRMFRADNARAIRSGGSGLGLYVVKSIIDQAGWKIRFESQENKGTVFYVDIPLSGMAKRGGQTKLTRGVV